MKIGIFLKDEKVFVSGGGAFNTYLISRISHYAKSEIIIPKNEIIDYKEALIFGFLGVLKLRNETNCLQSVTGAERDCSAGEIFKPQA
jgi:anhydro-N-acetylmuramic acid kinase